jgi:hypothetical protein
MRLGRPDLGIDAMEIYHDYFVKNGLWPDLIVVMKKGWQLHNYSFLLDGEENWMLNKAGHGTPNTSQVMLAIRGMGFPEGVSCGEEVKLFDVAATISNYLEWSFPEEAGRVLTCEN